MKSIFYLLMASILFGCSSTNEEKNTAAKEQNKEGLFYHYSIWAAFVNAIYDGSLTAAELKKKGDIGLGSYNALDGELVMLDGVLYEALGDGSVIVVEDDAKIAYTNATFYKEDQSFQLNSISNYDALRAELNEQLRSKNYFYAFKIHGTFRTLKLGGVPKQEKPYDEGLDVLIPSRPVFDKVNIKGTMVGFYCPEYIGQINVAGYHLHFISDDEKSAGHVMDFSTATQLRGGYMKIHKYQFDLPTTPEFDAVDLNKSFQYNKK